MRWLAAAQAGLLLLGCAHTGKSDPTGSVSHSAAAQTEAQHAASYTTEEGGSVLLGDAADGEAREAVRAACARAGLTVDERLARLALAVAQASHGGSIAPGGAFLSYQAQRHGVLEPTPQLRLSGTAQRAATLELGMRGLAEDARGRGVTHCGAALIHAEGRYVLSVALTGRFLTLERSVPRTLPRGEQLVLKGRLARGYRNPVLALTDPAGAVTRTPLKGAPKLDTALPLSRAGEHTVELLAEGPAGVTVLAVFPVYVGRAAPTSAPAYADAAGETSAEELVRNLLGLIADERKRQGLSALKPDARLAEVAQLHSQDMADHGFVAHTSKQSGEPIDRVKRAGLRTSLLLENIGRGYSAAEIHRGLMESPGHRGNILHPDAREIGVGVVAESEGERLAFLVTELFARVGKASTPEAARKALLEALAAQRKGQRLRPVVEDAQLTQLAQRAAERYARGEETRDETLLDRLMGSVKTPPRGVTRVGASLVRTEETEAVAVEAPLRDPTLRAVGVGVAELPERASHRYVVVMLLGNE